MKRLKILPILVILAVFASSCVTSSGKDATGKTDPDVMRVITEDEEYWCVDRASFIDIMKEADRSE